MAPHEYHAWVTEWARLMLAFVYPGAVLLAFGGTRTYHRLAAGLEDAGWIVGDSLMWVYASGFPKSHDISKAIDRETMVPCPDCVGSGFKVVAGDTVGDYERVTCATCGGTGQKLGAEREEVGDSGTGRKSQLGRKGGHTIAMWGNDEGVAPITAPATPAAQHWHGYGTALAPSYEPIVLARAPWSGTYAGIAGEYGTGAINVDGGRIGTSSTPRKDPRNGNLVNAHMEMFPWMERRIAEGKPLKGDFDGNQGRWPKNLILGCACESDEHAPDCPVEIMGAQSGESVSVGRINQTNEVHEAHAGYKRPNKSKYTHKLAGQIRTYDGTGTAARMFYQAKAAKWEREAGLHQRTPQTVNDGREKPIDNPYQRGETERRNTHPTVKPIQLTEYLARLILPPTLSEPRRLLVPFSGSGSEMIGATLAGWDTVIGFEQSTEYADIAEKRIAWWGQFKDYDTAKRAADADSAEQKQRADEAEAGVRQMALFEPEVDRDA